VGVFVVMIGLYLILKGLSNTKRLWNSKVFYYLKGLDNQSDDLPFYALSNMAKWYSPNPVKLTIHSDILESMYADLQFSQKAIMEKVSQYNSQEVFFAGIARVPCLFFIGYAFRNAHSTITLLDHDHKSDKWFSLKHTDDAHIDTIIESPILNHNGRVPNISVIIEFTCEIPIHDLPIGLQDQTVKIKLSNGYTHNQTTSKETVERIVNAIVQQLIILNKKCDRLHLFIAAQSTIAFSLGRRYQDGMIGNITVYNYDAVKKTYSWAISLINNKMELEKFE
jgi:hypothetical protein